MGLDPDRSPRLFSFKEITAHPEKLQEQMDRVSRLEGNNRGLFERKVAELFSHLQLYARLAQLDSLYLIPPLSPAEQWQSIGPFLQSPTNAVPKRNDASDLVLDILQAYHSGNPQQFNARVTAYRALLELKIPVQTRRADFEAFFNRFDPFFQSQILYVLIFTIGCMSWLGWARALGRAAFLLLLISLALHTFGLAARIYMSGRPPVTNLYSSAVFIAWAGVVLAVGLELYFKTSLRLWLPRRWVLSRF